MQLDGACSSCPPGSEFDGDYTDDDHENGACVETFNSNPFGEQSSGMTDVLSKASSTKSYMRASCAKDGKLPFLDGDGQPTIALDFFNAEDCSGKECLHVVDLTHDMCKSPDCKLPPEPGQMIREKDPEWGCGMCRPKFPAGWVNGRCYDLCMDNSDGRAAAGFSEPVCWHPCSPLVVPFPSAAF